MVRHGKGETVGQEPTAPPATGAARQAPSGARSDRGRISGCLRPATRVDRVNPSATAGPDEWPSRPGCRSDSAARPDRTRLTGRPRLPSAQFSTQVCPQGRRWRSVSHGLAWVGIFKEHKAYEKRFHSSLVYVQPQPRGFSTWCTAATMADLHIPAHVCPRFFTCNPCLPMRSHFTRSDGATKKIRGRFQIRGPDRPRR